MRDAVLQRCILRTQYAVGNVKTLFARQTVAAVDYFCFVNKVNKVNKVKKVKKVKKVNKVKKYKHKKNEVKYQAKNQQSLSAQHCESCQEKTC